MRERYTTLSAADLEVVLPSLDRLRVQVPAPAPASQGELVLRFEALRREHAVEQPRAQGEAVQPEDEILADLIGYLDQAILPYSARSDLWLDADTDLLLPGLRAALVGTRVGAQTAVALTLPPDYPVAGFAGAAVSFGVAVKAARAVRLPAADSPALLRAIGLGSTLDQTMEALAEQILDERTEATRTLAEHLMLQQLVARCDIPLTEAQVDEEIRLRWQAAEGRLLQAAGVEQSVQAAALAYWLADDALRAEVGERLRITAMLKALIVAKELQPSAKSVASYIDGYAEASGQDAAQIRSALQQDQEAQQDLYGAMLVLNAVRYLMKRTEVEVVAEADAD